MCSGGFDPFGPLKVVFDPTGVFGLNKQGLSGLTNPLGSAPRMATPIKPPKTDLNIDAANAAAQHQKDLLATAFALQDTKLTGQQGLGSVPKSLLAPKATIGGY